MEYVIILQIFLFNLIFKVAIALILSSCHE